MQAMRLFHPVWWAMCLLSVVRPVRCMSHRTMCSLLHHSNGEYKRQMLYIPHHVVLDFSWAACKRIGLWSNLCTVYRQSKSIACWAGGRLARVAYIVFPTHRAFSLPKFIDFLCTARLPRVCPGINDAMHQNPYQIRAHVASETDRI